jgi:hypothetical protein
MSSIQEIIDESNRLISDRQPWDACWDDIARLVLPMNDREFAKGGAPASQQTIEGFNNGPKSVEKGLSSRFDITGVVALDRLATGINSLVTPDSEKWQGIGLTDQIGGYREPSDAEARWLEKQRDYLMATRYNPVTGWTHGNQAALRSMCAFGSGSYFIEEAYGNRNSNAVSVPYRYSPLPLSENYYTVDGQGEIDGDYRRFSLEARAAAMLFGDKLSPKAKELANDPKKCRDKVEIIHLVTYRREAGYRSDPGRNSLVESCYIEVQTKHEIRRGGFNYWPIVTYHWNQASRSPYGESPVMLVLAEIKSVNILAKNALLMMQQLTRPPVATMDDANIGQKPNYNPAAINYGMLDARGELKAKPMLTAQNPGFVREVLEASRNQIKEGLYTTLWQILINGDPKQTATEALIRANEKGELLGPIGTKIQKGLSQLTDAELTILEGKGAWRPGALLEPPASLVGSKTRPTFNSPLDRLRRSNELIGINRTIEMAGALAQAGKPQVLDRLDEDAIIELAQEINGAPKKILRSLEDAQASRQAAQQQQQAMAAISAAQGMAKAGADASKALPAAAAMGDMMGNPQLAEAAKQNAA